MAPSQNEHDFDAGQLHEWIDQAARAATKRRPSALRIDDLENNPVFGFLVARLLRRRLGWAIPLRLKPLREDFFLELLFDTPIKPSEVAKGIGGYLLVRREDFEDLPNVGLGDQIGEAFGKARRILIGLFLLGLFLAILVESLTGWESLGALDVALTPLAAAAGIWLAAAWRRAMVASSAAFGLERARGQLAAAKSLESSLGTGMESVLSGCGMGCAGCFAFGVAAMGGVLAGAALSFLPANGEFWGVWVGLEAFALLLWAFSSIAADSKIKAEQERLAVFVGRWARQRVPPQ